MTAAGLDGLVGILISTALSANLQVRKVGKAQRAPRSSASAKTLSRLIRTEYWAFWISGGRYAGAGPRCALPTFPTCKFWRLVAIL